MQTIIYDRVKLWAAIPEKSKHLVNDRISDSKDIDVEYLEDCIQGTLVKLYFWSYYPDGIETNFSECKSIVKLHEIDTDMNKMTYYVMDGINNDKITAIHQKIIADIIKV